MSLPKKPNKSNSPNKPNEPENTENTGQSEKSEDTAQADAGRTQAEQIGPGQSSRAEQPAGHTGASKKPTGERLAITPADLARTISTVQQIFFKKVREETESSDASGEEVSQWLEDSGSEILEAFQTISIRHTIEAGSFGLSINEREAEQREKVGHTFQEIIFVLEGVIRRAFLRVLSPETDLYKTFLSTVASNRVVEAAEGIIDDEEKALSDQLEETVEALLTTGSPDFDDIPDKAEETEEAQQEAEPAAEEQRQRAAVEGDDQYEVAAAESTDAAVVSKAAELIDDKQADTSTDTDTQHAVEIDTKDKEALREAAEVAAAAVHKRITED